MDVVIYTVAHRSLHTILMSPQPLPHDHVELGALQHVPVSNLLCAHLCQSSTAQQSILRTKTTLPTSLSSPISNIRDATHQPSIPTPHQTLRIICTHQPRRSSCQLGTGCKSMPTWTLPTHLRVSSQATPHPDSFIDLYTLTLACWLTKRGR